ncbi:hypothetical protein [Nocardia sp. NPDC004860]|uniref:hypothetical protein n=1 Tax=Nocardia sp. NPDC004860 TaxID=3154557 RepID=UPI0033A6322D
MARVAYQSDHRLTPDDPDADEVAAESVIDQAAAEPSIDEGAEGPAVEEPDDESATPARTFAAPALGLVVLVVALIALAVATVLMFLQVRSTDAHKSRDAAAVAAARQMVVDLTTLSQQAVEPDINRILAETTGSFRDQFTHQADTFRQVLSKGAVDSTGEVTEAGLSSADDDHAEVLVASTSTVKNTDAPDGQQRVYRMKVSLQHVSGAWLVSNVEFVS